MDIAPDGEETDQNLYLGVFPLIPNQRWNQNFMEEDPSDPLTDSNDPVAPATPNFTINENPDSVSQFLNLTPSISPSSPSEGFALDPDNSLPVLQSHLRDTVSGPDVTISPLRDYMPELQVGPTMPIPVADLVINGSRADWVSLRDRLQEYPLLRFQRLMDVNRSSMTTASATGTALSHPDTSPERLMNNILALEASRKERLKNGKGNNTTSTEKKNGEGACQCGVNFECNICLETSIEPVVTPCGHLFCWRCLYRWIRTQLLDISECPVCKGEITESSLTPIYGRGGSGSASGPVPRVAMEEIPPRPSGRRTDSTRQLMRQEREVRGRGVGYLEVERVRMELEAVVARLRRLPRSSRAGSGSRSALGLVPGVAMEEIPPRPSGRRTDSTRHLMRRESEVRGHGVGFNEVERVTTDLESVLAWLRQMPRSSRGASDVVGNTAEVISGGLAMGRGSGQAGEEVGEGGGGEGTREGNGLDSGAGSSVAGEMHLRRRRRYRGEGDGLDSGAGLSVAGEMHVRRRRRHR